MYLMWFYYVYRHQLSTVQKVVVDNFLEMVLGCWCRKSFNKLNVSGSKKIFASSCVSLVFFRFLTFEVMLRLLFFSVTSFSKLHCKQIIKSKLETHSNNILYLLHSHRFRLFYHRRYRRQHGFALWTQKLCLLIIKKIK